MPFPGRTVNAAHAVSALAGVLASQPMSGNAELQELLAAHLDAGVDETLDDRPHDRYAKTARREEPQTPHAWPPAEAAPARPASGKAAGGAPAGAPARTPDALGAVPYQDARALARSCDSLEALRAALQAFEGCALKRTATTTVVGDGNPKSRLMLVGEAPGAEEDRQGLPFVGPAGKLLDRMLAAIGLDRRSVYITNVLPWRPPGNRTPAPEEVAQCLPFVERQIELVAPLVLVLVGGVSAKALLGRSEGITKLRGRWFDYQTPGLVRPVPACALFHPAYLLRQPAQKRQAWADLIEIKAKLAALLAGEA